jgi:beta-lactamase regulating signal transducer with metallopeptidase domain
MIDPTWILGTLAKATVLLLAGAGVAVGLRRGSAAWRHLAWGTAVAGLLVLPLVSLAVPWRLAVVPLPARTAAEGSGAVAPPPAPQTRSSQSAEPGHVGVASATAGADVSDGGATVLSPTRIHLGWPVLLVGIWALGALVLLGRLAIGSWVLRRVVRRAAPLKAAEWRRRLLEGADRLALDRLPALVVSDRLPMPFACGLLRPAIVLPTTADAWSDRRRQAVLYHELAHLSRHDLLMNAIGQVVCALYWFHPLVWIAARKVRVESERACDDLVLSVGTRPSEYADHLLQIVCRAARAHTPAVALPMAQRHEFEGRMLAILERAARRDPASGRHAAGVGALTLALVLPLAALAPATPHATPSSAPASAGAPTRPVTPLPAQASTTPTRPAPARETRRPPLAPAANDSNAVVAALVRALDDSVSSVREDAAYALGRLEAQAAVQRLGVALARDPAPKVREMVAWALGQIGDHSGGAALGAAARRDSSDAVRAMAVWALGRVGDPAAVPDLEVVLRDRSTEVRGRAAWALGTIAPAQAPAGLVAALRDPDADVRLRAAWALGRIGDTTAVPGLAAALHDSATTVRRAVLWALGRVGGDAAQNALLRAVEDPDPEVRTRAVRALAGNHGDPWPWPWPMPIIR